MTSGRADRSKAWFADLGRTPKARGACICANKPPVKCKACGELVVPGNRCGEDRSREDWTRYPRCYVHAPHRGDCPRSMTQVRKRARRARKDVP